MNSEKVKSILSKRKLQLLLISLVLLAWIPMSKGQAGDIVDDTGQNRLTIYVIPSKVKYDWSSPRSLYKSFVKNYKRNLFSKNSYLLGHAFIELQSPKLEEDILTGMRSASRGEQKEMLLKEHYGLAVLGADMTGRLEEREDLEKTIAKFSRKGRLGFMDFIVSDEAMDRMILYFQSYKSYFTENGYESMRYGGAFWPRYEGEGAGCSAFAVSFLDLAGILTGEFQHWLVSINIPMELIGGPYNDNEEVRLKEIRRSYQWADENNSNKLNYEHFEIYDPCLMFEWIRLNWQDEMINGELQAKSLKLNDAKGIMIDARNEALPEEETLFMDRENSSIFIDIYKEKQHFNNAPSEKMYE